MSSGWQWISGDGGFFPKLLILMKFVSDTSLVLTFKLPFDLLISIGCTRNSGCLSGMGLGCFK